MRILNDLRSLQCIFNDQAKQAGRGELLKHTFAKYYETCELLIGQFGRDRRVDDLRPDDFEAFRKSLAKNCGFVTLKSKINRCRVVLKYASDNRLIDRSVEYGCSFDRPSAKMMCQARNGAGERIFEAAEIRLILNASDLVMRAMVLLGINCGFGNTDVASLPQSAIDLEKGWVIFSRPMTAIRRRVPLWPETVGRCRMPSSNDLHRMIRLTSNCVSSQRGGRDMFAFRRAKRRKDVA